MSETPVEITIKYVTTVSSLTEAWSFIMARLDSLEGAPSIKINPVWRGPDYDVPRFDVVVEAMHEEETVNREK